MDKRDITFVLPVFNLSEDRVKTFLFVFHKIRESGCKIIICHQRNSHIPCEFPPVHFPNTKYYSLDIDDDKIHKSTLINYGVKKADTRFVWVNDIDCYLKFPEIMPKLNPANKFIQPFVSVKSLTEGETDTILDGGYVTIDYSIRGARQVHVYGAMSFIFNKKDFLDIGAMDEQYTGWGLEDYDLFDRVSQKHDIDIINTSFGVHLWHPIVPSNTNNISQFNRKGLNVEELDSLAAKLLQAATEGAVTINHEVGDDRHKRSLSILQNIQDVISTKVLTPEKVNRVKGNKIAHVVNYISPRTIKNSHLKNRVELTLQSIEAASEPYVHLIGCVSDKIKRKNWSIHQLQRTAKTEFGADKDFAFLKDMLDIGCNEINDDDYIFYSNLDCMVIPDIYKDILKSKEDVIVFHRRDIKKCTNLNDVFSSSYIVKKTGVDGIAIRKSVYNEYRDRIPDFLIGEPHWDTTIVNMFKKFHYVKTNTKHMYHIIHEQAWDTSNLSSGGEWNTELYLTAKKYGLINEPIISVNYDDVLIIVDTGNIDNDIQKVIKFCKHVTDRSIVLLELINIDSRYPSSFTQTVKYLPIYHTNDNTRILDQSNALINIGISIFGQYDEHSVITCNDINADRYNTNTIVDGHFLDVYTNDSNRDRSFINDIGLLEAIG